MNVSGDLRGRLVARRRGGDERAATSRGLVGGSAELLGFSRGEEMAGLILQLAFLGLSGHNILMGRPAIAFSLG